MPFVSKKQQKWGHSPVGIKALGGPDAVQEWDAATDFSSLPEKKQAEGAISKGMKSRRSAGGGILGKRFQSK